MKTPSSTSSLITRRNALGLFLAGVTLPATRSLAATGGTIAVYVHVLHSGTQLVTCSGESLTASFESELLVGSGGDVRGYMRFTIGTEVVDYVAERGGLDLDSAGNPIRAVVLMRRRGSSGKDARDFLLATVAPHPVEVASHGEDCLIYTTAGNGVYAEPVRFEVPGAWQVRRTRD